MYINIGYTTGNYCIYMLVYMHYVTNCLEYQVVPGCKGLRSVWMSKEMRWIKYSWVDITCVFAFWTFLNPLQSFTKIFHSLLHMLSYGQGQKLSKCNKCPGLQGVPFGLNLLATALVTCVSHASLVLSFLCIVQIDSYIMYCDGVPAPEDADNALKYKVWWGPLNVSGLQ